MTSCLSIEHSTQYQYGQDVILAQHLGYLRPQNTVWQTVTDYQLVVTPTPDEMQTETDAFGNHRVFFALTHPHRALDVHCRSTVEVRRRYGDLTLSETPAWELVRDSMVYSLEQPFVAASEFVWPSPYVAWLASLKEYALPSFTRNRPIGLAAMELCERIFHDFTYESGSTEVHTPLEVAFNHRKGVCQDFAHIMIGCLRTLGLSAKYVSGYLLTKPPPGQERLRGADATHAWVNVYCPNAAGNWLALDPTNATIADLDHVCLAEGRDFGDISPLRGIIRGGGHHELSIAVTVEPTPLR
ncbi:transglutaminase family protein [Orrella daihaiensis]|uniref:Transglutaminase family protein n=1 Tax=Orrella daihaiensis TaxID=2782176 RepID=A0ABY4AJU6_9BURK|nr:transglutaminase family protein [Orrella daihaiensis]UOD50551.1 transglutaminase family protein [Orrella daihaiensis]